MVPVTWSLLFLRKSPQRHCGWCQMTQQGGRWKRWSFGTPPGCLGGGGVSAVAHPPEPESLGAENGWVNPSWDPKMKPPRSLTLALVVGHPQHKAPRPPPPGRLKEAWWWRRWPWASLLASGCVTSVCRPCCQRLSACTMCHPPSSRPSLSSACLSNSSRAYLTPQPCARGDSRGVFWGVAGNRTRGNLPPNPPGIPG